jgi:DNA-binding MarR family transcriptional regulator
MQPSQPKDPSDLIAGIVREEVPNPRAIDAWTAFLRAHATLMRALDSDLRAKTGSGINDFDVLATVAYAGGSMRMADLAERAYSSRSGMTRRVDRLVAEGLVARTGTGADGRGVVVQLTPAGTNRIAKLARVHMQEIRRLFVDRLTEDKLAALEAMLLKVCVDTTFG